MNIRKIIEILMGDVCTDAESRLELTEDSFLPEIVNKETKGDEDNNAFTTKVCWQDYKRRRFPLTWLLLNSVCYVLKCTIYAIYWVIERIWCLLTMKSPKNNLGLSPRMNLVLMLSVLTFYIITLASMLSFFVKDVVLFRPETYVNDSGAICFPQSCKREHYMFLVNSAQCWTNTGIKVLKGDRVLVTASGSFFSKISEMDKSARSNIILPYMRVNVLQESQKDNRTRDLWMYHGDSARFGSLLVQIKDDYQKPSCRSEEGKIRQINIGKCGHVQSFIADSTGVLNFSVNDIYLNNGCLDLIYEQKDLLHLDEASYRNVKKNYKEHPQMWFDNNVGDILLSIRVDRKNLNIKNPIRSCMAYAYFGIDNFFFSPHVCCCLMFLCFFILLWLGIDLKCGTFLRSIKSRDNSKTLNG